MSLENRIITNKPNRKYLTNYLRSKSEERREMVDMRLVGFISRTLDISQAEVYNEINNHYQELTAFGTGD